jgi:hypothetical protein
MEFSKLADRVVTDISAAVSAEITAADRSAISQIVRKALSEASGNTVDACREAAVICCGPEADLAHKIQHELDKKRDMLIANLMSMR